MNRSTFIFFNRVLSLATITILLCSCTPEAIKLAKSSLSDSVSTYGGPLLQCDALLDGRALESFSMDIVKMSDNEISFVLC